MFFRPFISILSFLTIIPMPKYHNYNLNTIARNMYFFPLCGAIIGLIVGVVAFISLSFVPTYIASLAILVTYVIITGIHHIDGLADFADGLMIRGNRESKRKAMLDPIVGSAGATALVINFIGLFIALSNFESPLKLFYAIIVSEVIGKYVMVLQATVGKSSWSGSSSPFTIEMKKGSKIIISLLFTVTLVIFMQGIDGLLVLAIVILIGFVIYLISYKNFGGVNGDVFGASNEICRLTSLLILSAIAI